MTVRRLPDFRGRHLEGASADNAVGTHLEAGIPNIVTPSTIEIASAATNNTQGCFVRTGSRSSRDEGTTGTFIYTNYKFNAKEGEAQLDGTLKTIDMPHVFGNSETVQPDSVCVNFIIKY